MRLKIRVSDIKSVYKIFKDKAKIKDEYVESSIMWKNDDNIIEADMHKLEPGFIEELYAYGMKIKDKPEGNTILQACSMYKNVIANPVGLKVGNLNQLCSAFTVYIKKHSRHKWLGSFNSDNLPIYYAVTNIVYTPADSRRLIQADVTITMTYILNDKLEKCYKSWGSQDVKKLTVPDLLKSKGLFTVTDEHVKQHGEHTERYMKVSASIGEQFTAPSALGKYSYNSSNSDRWLGLSEDNVPHRLVVDENYDKVTPAAIESSLFWSLSDDDGEDNARATDEDKYLKIPTHPYVRMFNLKKHVNVSIHVSALKEYEYDSSLVSKLILPAPIRSILDILVSSNAALMSDIIKGKSGGIIVLATGDPGTGKTLTAETHAEMMRRPLYSVQCSQLGVDVGKLEKELEIVLTRSVKWNAILLIDEADVYIRAREKDIQQNAIVGVFLRVLEYHSGTIFMTSNLGQSIDDAIVSRCTAWIKYPRPTKEEQTEIWKVLRTQFQAKLDDKEITKIMGEYDWLVGRDIKTLLKLSNMVAISKKEPIKLETVKLVSAFHSISSREKPIAA